MFTHAKTQTELTPLEQIAKRRARSVLKCQLNYGFVALLSFCGVSYSAHLSHEPLGLAMGLFATIVGVGSLLLLLFSLLVIATLDPNVE